ncbi:TRAP transporter small permease [Bacillus dakarensis]|uniref:TRAP transporter small permease n=1 Tax=Robertmurraya dakarensis TaxID=1926278 RepID=UPI003B0249ED
MLFLTISSALRSGNHPILGDVEITSLLMVCIIFFGIPYTQSKDAHIKIGLFADRLPWYLQKVLDITSSILTFFMASIISIVYYHTTLRYIENPEFSVLLNIPLLPFKILIFILSLLWAVECILKLFLDISKSRETYREGE